MKAALPHQTHTHESAAFARIFAGGYFFALLYTWAKF